MKLGIAALALVVLPGCGPAIAPPPSGPNTEYPCGIRGQLCSSGKCCDEEDVCGGGPFTGCPVDSCCFVGNETARYAQRAPRR